MPVAAAKRAPARFDEGPDGGWWFTGWGSPRIAAGVTGRGLAAAELLGRLPPSFDRAQGSTLNVPRLAFARSGLRRAKSRRDVEGPPVTAVEAEQVHGAGIAVVGEAPFAGPVPGCDALVTGCRGTALLVRSADCLPIFFADPRREVIGLAHAGWRGLAAWLPARVVATFRHVFHSRPGDLHVAIGPGIRGCCYEVGRDFPRSFAPFIQEREGRRPSTSFRTASRADVEGRRTCDLIAAAAAQLRACGVAPARLTDAQRCTACEPRHWYSLRREGPETGRLTALIVVKP